MPGFDDMLPIDGRSAVGSPRLAAAIGCRQSVACLREGGRRGHSLAQAQTVSVTGTGSLAKTGNPYGGERRHASQHSRTDSKSSIVRVNANLMAPQRTYFGGD